jgi:hypothetical protein
MARDYGRVTRGRWARGLLALIAVMMAVTSAQGAGAATPSGRKFARTVRALKERYPLRSVLFGVWVNGRRLAGGALGESQPGVPATMRDHFRIGITTHRRRASGS